MSKITDCPAIMGTIKHCMAVLDDMPEDIRISIEAEAYALYKNLGDQINNSKPRALAGVLAISVLMHQTAHKFEEMKSEAFMEAITEVAKAASASDTTVN